MAAGDDVIVYALKGEEVKFVDSYKKYVSTHDKSINQHGLG